MINELHAVYAKRNIEVPGMIWHRIRPVPWRAEELSGYAHGVLAPNAKLRSKIVPAPVERATDPSTDHTSAHGETPRMSLARLLKRVSTSTWSTAPTAAAP